MSQESQRDESNKSSHAINMRPDGDFSFELDRQSTQQNGVTAKSKKFLTESISSLNDNDDDFLNRSLPPLTPLNSTNSSKFSKYQQSSPIRISNPHHQFGGSNKFKSEMTAARFVHRDVVDEETEDDLLLVTSSPKKTKTTTTTTPAPALAEINQRKNKDNKEDTTSSLITATDSFDSSVGDDSVFLGEDDVVPSLTSSSGSSSGSSRCSSKSDQENARGKAFISQSAPYPATNGHVVNTLKQKQRAHMANLSVDERDAYLARLNSDELSSNFESLSVENEEKEEKEEAVNENKNNSKSNSYSKVDGVDDVEDQCVPRVLHSGTRRRMRDYGESGDEHASLFEAKGAKEGHETSFALDISDPSGVIIDEMEQGIRCYFNDYIIEPSSAHSAQKQKYEEFKDVLLSSTRNLDESLNISLSLSLITNNNNNNNNHNNNTTNNSSDGNLSSIVMSSSSPAASSSSDKTRSIVFFLEGFDQHRSIEHVGNNNNNNNNNSSNSNSNSNNISDFRTRVSSSSFEAAKATAEGVDIPANLLRRVEANLMLKIKSLKRENANNPLVNNEIYIAVLTFVASEPKLNQSIISKMGQLIDHLDENEFSQAKQIQTGLRLNYKNETSSWIVGIEKLINQLKATTAAKKQDSP